MMHFVQYLFPYRLVVWPRKTPSKYAWPTLYGASPPEENTIEAFASHFLDRC